MKLVKSLPVLLLFVVTCSMTSCNKETEPVIFTGTWEIDTSSTFVLFVYNQDLESQYPNVLNFLRLRKYDIKSKIQTPARIEFIEPNRVIFYYDDSKTSPVEGTYTQYEAYVTIVNDIFPSGIAAASNNIKLEIYYGTNYMLNQLYSLLTPEDDPQEYFSYVIDSADGVGVYTKQ
jgi:hypothetical protein